jgi:type II secretory pathway component PulF
MKKINKKSAFIFQLSAFAFLLTFLLPALSARAQDGSSGINQATTMVKGYFDAGCNLMYAIGAILGIVGAIKVYRKWNEGEPDTNKVAAAWFGSCIFLVVVATVIKSFFGL